MNDEIIDMYICSWCNQPAGRFHMCSNKILDALEKKKEDDVTPARMICERRMNTDYRPYVYIWVPVEEAPPEGYVPRCYIYDAGINEVRPYKGCGFGLNYPLNPSCSKCIYRGKYIDSPKESEKQ